MTKDRLTAARIAKLKTLILMLDHMLPDLHRLDKVSAHVMSMLLLALQQKLREMEDQK